jgi:hypothetical protein
MPNLEKLAFEQWMLHVNNAMAKLCGMTADDLPDYDYHQAFEEGRLPRVTARQAVRAAGGF